MLEYWNTGFREEKPIIIAIFHHSIVSLKENGDGYQEISTDLSRETVPNGLDVRGNHFLYAREKPSRPDEKVRRKKLLWTNHRLASRRRPQEDVPADRFQAG
jgi:hypothetical protein